MKGDIRMRSVSLALVMAAILALVAPAAAWADEIPWGGPTSLPDYIGAPAKPHPLPNSRAPQNPFLAPNPFSHPHSDTWNSDTVDIAGPLGRDPEVLSSTLAEARATSSPFFACGTMGFDSHGRPVMMCIGIGEAKVVVADATTLEALAWYAVPPPTNRLTALGSAYFFVDSRDQVTVVGYPNLIWTLREGGSAAEPTLELVDEYDLAALVPAGDNIAGVMTDYQGQLWFDTAGVADDPAKVCLLNRVTYPDVKCVSLGENEDGTHAVIRNTFAVAKDGAYIASSEKMYRFGVGAGDQPYVVWSEPYKTIGVVKPGQYSLGSGTSPTILGNGKYVAITDNAEQLHVVVLRTAEQLGPKEERIVCEQEVFEPGAGADENSLVGSGLSLLAENNYAYAFNFDTGAMKPNVPGFTRIDIDPNGKGCSKVWGNSEVASSVCGHLSTRTGLYYTLARVMDESNKDDQHPYGVDVYYWTALDFRTGEVVWQKMAGTGTLFDGWYPCVGIGPNGTAYVGQYGGLLAIRDAR
jgi:hypothetical protein